MPHSILVALGQFRPLVILAITSSALNSSLNERMHEAGDRAQSGSSINQVNVWLRNEHYSRIPWVSVKMLKQTLLMPRKPKFRAEVCRSRRCCFYWPSGGCLKDAQARAQRCTGAFSRQGNCAIG